ncbi:TAXI family TRAP transporter solute-binding subunit [Dethiobacter alkaliphilus]|uniref:TAXI family TRAP transporter solute-binding subunit n=1 Tax=Dethiobacter alkaliphilus TaxID=427926 RepID=UPI0022268EA3|nr:TAXI family TRAP transporter solute-binding subunit [Dethiobacter alkaliphilus]MCW3489682.1 TAXI family TRAP transporter solute-binding subunit [Dethiobacter alkaliphilus]
MKKKWTMFITLIFVVAVMVTALTGCGEGNGNVNGDNNDTGDASPSFISIASGSPGGAYFPLGAGMAKVITDNVEGVFAQSESTGASVENARLVGSGASEMGMAMANVAYDAYAGQGDFDGDQQDVVALFSMYPAAQHLIVGADSDIYSIEDLVGKTVSVDAAGSGAEVTSYIILEAAGIRDEVNTRNFSQPEAADALKDGQVDAVFYNFAHPGAVVEEIMTTKDIRFIPIEDELLDAIIDDYPYFTKGVIPAGVYGLDEDVSALTVGNLMLVHSDMDEDFAYALVEAMFKEASLDELVGIHQVAALMNLQDSAVSPIPLHPGAERFFQEQ